MITTGLAIGGGILAVAALAWWINIGSARRSWREAHYWTAAQFQINGQRLPAGACLGPRGECLSWYDENRCAACPKHRASAATTGYQPRSPGLGYPPSVPPPGGSSASRPAAPKGRVPQ
jgi:hypothetical protein